MLARVSELESFRRWREDDDASLDALLAHLRGQERPSEHMAAGTAFHRALELAEPGEFDTLRANGFVFHVQADIELELPLIRELRASKAYIVDGGCLSVSGQVDSILGRRIDDHKTTAQMDAEGYFAGYQWRLYLELFQADRFRWNVFEVREASDTMLRDINASADESHYVVHGGHRLEQHRYPGLADDCAVLAADFYRFAQQHLPERFEVPA